MELLYCTDYGKEYCYDIDKDDTLNALAEILREEHFEKVKTKDEEKIIEKGIKKIIDDDDLIDYFCERYRIELTRYFSCEALKNYCDNIDTKKRRTLL